MVMATTTAVNPLAQHLDCNHAMPENEMHSFLSDEKAHEAKGVLFIPRWGRMEG